MGKWRNYRHQNTNRKTDIEKKYGYINGITDIKREKQTN